MSKTSNLEGKQFSLAQLFETSDYKIEIPRIQRDYAQGRKSKSEIRNLFLEALYDYLIKDEPFKNLDFIYGYNETTKFIPLDGQQRITTLFLLHWYLAILSDNYDSFLTLFSNQKKTSRFTYNTRFSSSEFCDLLVLNGSHFRSLFLTQKDKNGILSVEMKNQSWYVYDWNHDPTIMGMLQMLDSIHSKFKSNPEFYNKLVSNDRPIITFIYLDIDDLGLNEDLYIKMNSRGKPLTNFENFKAKFEQEIDKCFEGLNHTLTLSIDSIDRKVSVREYFSYKIDTVWSNLFWNYRHLIGDVNTFDDELLNFINVILSFNFAVNEDNNGHLLLLHSAKSANKDDDSLTFSLFNNTHVINVDSILLLINSLDSIYNDNKPLLNLIDTNSYYNENDFFNKALTNDFSYPERVLFYGYLKYLVNFGKNKQGLNDWMRVLYNLVENTRIDDFDQFIAVIKSTDKLVASAENILEYLITDDCLIDSFYPPQIIEEKVKAHLIIKSNDWADFISNSESSGFHKGQIGYILDFSGVLSKFKNSTFKISDVELVNLLHLAKIYFEKSMTLFTLKSNENEFVVERAVLTKGNYLIPAKGHKLNFASSNKVSNYMRDFSWRRILRLPDQDKELWDEKRYFIKALFDDSRFDKSNIIQSLKSISNDRTDSWRDYFIINPDLIKYCRQGYIYKPNYNNQCILFKQSAINHYHIDMRVFNLYTLKFANYTDAQIDPFKNSYCEQSKTDSDNGWFTLNEFLYKKVAYELTVQFFEKDDDNSYFEVCFIKSKNKKNIDSYQEEIQELLEEFKFKWYDTDNLFCKKVATEKSTIKLIDDFILACRTLKSK